MDGLISVFIEKIRKNYSHEEFLIIKDALIFATEKHSNQRRKSGEPYIIHPISVANVLCDMQADADTICAALLHDVIEDTDTTKEELATIFGKDVSELVDGVTKIKSTTFYTKEAGKAAYIRKLTTSILSDVRVIIIKLIDRLHNMETLEYQERNKQIKIAKETLELYVPLAYYLGIYKVRFLLEDLAFKYLNVEKFNEITTKRDELVEEGQTVLDDIIENLKKSFDYHNINYKMEKSTKNIYGIYKRLQNGERLSNISDLLRIKIIVDDMLNCYKVLGLVHSLYHPINGRFKDYISSPKTNMYQSIHTTIFANFNKLVQLQIRTREMNEIDIYGIINVWRKKNKVDMQKYLFDNFPFMLVLKDIDERYPDNDKFMEKLYHDVLKEKVYIFVGNGNVMELPKGSTLRDLCQVLNVTEDRLLVNDNPVSLEYLLRNNDCVTDVKRMIKRLI